MNRIVTILLFASVALGQPALVEALKLTRAQRYAEARKALEGVPEPEPAEQRIAYHRLKAAIASGLHDASGAAVEMQAALRLDPANPNLMTAAAAAELQAGQLDEALAHVQGAGNLAIAKELLGDIQEKRRDYVAAAQAYQDAVALAPDREPYRIALALELVSHQTFQPAIAVLRQAAPLFPKSAKIRALLGIAQYAYGDIPASIAALTEALHIDPKLEPADVYLSKIVLESSGPAPRAAMDALCGWNEIVCSALKLRAARERDDKKLLNESIAGLKRAAPDNAVARCELGRAYEWTNAWKDAKVEMEACVKLDPSPPNHLRLGQVYKELGDTAQAHDEMERYKESLKQLSEDSARRLDAIQGFEYTFR